jgi:hypothetical protein
MRSMSEKNLYLDGLELDYEGTFDIKELLKTIDGLIKQRGYSKGEKRREEVIREKGKAFSMELRPVKKKTDYFVLMIKMRIHITDMTDVEVIKDDMKTMMNKGKVSILFDAWTTTDYEFRWEKKPLFYFLRNLFERTIYKFHTDRFAGELVEDTRFIMNNIRAFLNLGKL